MGSLARNLFLAFTLLLLLQGCLQPPPSLPNITPSANITPNVTPPSNVTPQANITPSAPPLPEISYMTLDDITLALNDNLGVFVDVKYSNGTETYAALKIGEEIVLPSGNTVKVEVLSMGRMLASKWVKFSGPEGSYTLNAGEDAITFEGTKIRVEDILQPVGGAAVFEILGKKQNVSLGDSLVVAGHPYKVSGIFSGVLLMTNAVELQTDGGRKVRLEVQQVAVLHVTDVPGTVIKFVDTIPAPLPVKENSQKPIFILYSADKKYEDAFSISQGDSKQIGNYEVTLENVVVPEFPGRVQATLSSGGNSVSLNVRDIALVGNKYLSFFDIAGGLPKDAPNTQHASVTYYNPSGDMTKEQYEVGESLSLPGNATGTVIETDCGVYLAAKFVKILTPQGVKLISAGQGICPDLRVVSQMSDCEIEGAVAPGPGEMPSGTQIKQLV